jgi:ElaB/YqjD/DUF883 family membrane-anchored ribosome-binding protein
MPPVGIHPMGTRRFFGHVALPRRTALLLRSPGNPSTAIRNTMRTKTEIISNEAGHLADAAHDFISTNAEVAGDASVEVRKQLEAVVDRGRVYYDRVCETAVDGARAAEEAVHQQPYKSLAITLGVGVIFGFLLARR